jgi:hypothetical protein
MLCRTVVRDLRPFFFVISKISIETLYDPMSIAANVVTAISIFLPDMPRLPLPWGRCSPLLPAEAGHSN